MARILWNVEEDADAAEMLFTRFPSTVDLKRGGDTGWIPVLVHVISRRGCKEMRLLGRELKRR
jgi:hypothetical protein